MKKATILTSFVFTNIKRRAIIKTLTICTLLTMGTFYPGSGKAQSQWLSTPQSVAEFRAQVESFKPAKTAFELFSVRDISVELTGRSVLFWSSPTGHIPKGILILNG
jgi:hypothetical protein